MSNGLDDKKIEIKEELNKLKHEYKIELPRVIAEARAYGDLKENAEYHAARERQSFVKARISQLTAHLSQLGDMNMSDIPEGKVGFGSEVTIYNITDESRLIFTIVSSDEVNPSEGKISLSSPIGNALRDRGAGEEFEVNMPVGAKKYFIEKLVTIHGDEFLEEYSV
jgi:transcription elongation factor GreA